MMEETLKLLREMGEMCPQVVNPKMLQDRLDCCIAECEAAVLTQKRLEAVTQVCRDKSNDHEGSIPWQDYDEVELQEEIEDEIKRTKPAVWGKSNAAKLCIECGTTLTDEWFQHGSTKFCGRTCMKSWKGRQ